MAIIARYKFNPSLCADYLPTFNAEFTGYTKTDVDNGDGTITRTISHDTLKPTFMRFGVKGAVTDREKSLLEIMQCDTSQITNMESMFRTCSNLVILDASGFNTSKTKNMNAMFQYCSSLTNLDLSNFDTSNVNNMSYMFSDCSALTSLDLSNFDTSNATNMQAMFNSCTSLTSLDLSNFDTSNVNNMGGMFNKCPVSNIGLLYTTSTTINGLLTELGTSTARNIYYTDAPLNELTVQDNITYKKYKLTMATFPYTLNKLPNGVADYIDVVNKVHVQRVGVFVADGADTKSWSIGTFSNSSVNTECTIFSTNISDKLNNWNINHKICDKWSLYNTDITSNDIANIEGVHSGGNADSFFINVSNTKATTVEQWKTYLQSNPFTYLYELKTPIYTPLTDEEIAQLPLSAYKDGYINLSSDQLTPSFEFRMRASNRYQVGMLETGYYYLNAPTGNVKLGTANVDVQQMPCIVKVDNVGTGDSGYRLGINGHTSFLSLDKSNFTLGYYYNYSGELVASARDCASKEYIPISTDDTVLVNQLYQSTADPYSVSLVLYDSDKNMVDRISLRKDIPQKIVANNVSYFRFSCIHDRTVTEPTTKVAEVYINPITLAKLPSHRIPTSFTQGMKCGTDFGYWEGIMVSKPTSFRTANPSSGWSIVETSSIEGGMGVVLNRIESGNTIIEDEFDVATGKFTKRIGEVVLDGSHNCSRESFTVSNQSLQRYIIRVDAPHRNGCLGLTNCLPFLPSQDKYGVDYVRPYTTNGFWLYQKEDLSTEEVKKRLARNPITVYYELEVPEISYLNTSLSQVKTVANTGLQCTRNNGYLNAQVKPSHLTYPVPSLVGNRTYTVVHNRKNITGSTKPITLNLGGTQVELNDASSKTLVKTPSTLKHSSLIFTGGESTVDHVMVLDGDWTNKPIEYFENMKGHDTDAIITIIGNGQINDVAEQYLW